MKYAHLAKTCFKLIDYFRTGPSRSCLGLRVAFLNELETETTSTFSNTYSNVIRKVVFFAQLNLIKIIFIDFHVPCTTDDARFYKLPITD